MTDDEIKQYLRPRTHWGSILGTAIALLTAAAAVGRFVFTAPTDVMFRDHENRLRSQEIDGAVFKKSVEGLRDDVAGTKSDIKDVKVDLKLLLERRR